ncbi:hypothetical protein F5Y12DRAFT_688020 [Xylaria sp. FL1777]|nr:hypothetical protein F5Y12DRAFT_688020 [Xylaria sp. FL1777]
MAKRVRSVLIFFEWLGRTFMMYNRVGFILSVITAGTLSTEPVRMMMTSYRGVNTTAYYIATPIPAVMLYMDVIKYLTTFSINNSITDVKVESNTMISRRNIEHLVGRTSTDSSWR